MKSMVLILLFALCYAIYRMAIDYNITPWKWIIRYVLVFMASFVPLSMILLAIYGESTMKDIKAVEKITDSLQPMILLYQIVLFFVFRSWIIRYVHLLDVTDKNNDNTPPTPPAKKDQKEQKDFSYFR